MSNEWIVCDDRDREMRNWHSYDSSEDEGQTLIPARVRGTQEVRHYFG